MKPNNEKIKALIRDRAEIFWSIPDAQKENISRECLVENILNYGTMDDVIKMIEILGIQETARIFSRTTRQASRHSNKYHELTLNYFNVFFKKHADLPLSEPKMKSNNYCG